MNQTKKKDKDMAISTILGWGAELVLYFPRLIIGLWKSMFNKLKKKTIKKERGCAKMHDPFLHI